MIKIFSKIGLPFLVLLILLPVWGFTYQSKSNFESDADSLQQPYLSENVFDLLLAVHGNLSPTEKDDLRKDLAEFTVKLARKQQRFNSEERFIKKAFYKIHNRYLKHYRKHSDFYELLDKGNYDCITGTAFYALIFDALGITYQIQELPYHVYLTVETKGTGKLLLLESTDNMSGFVSDKEEIALRIKDYEQALNDPTSVYYRYNFEIKETISLEELAGLNYFNEAIVHYNQQNLSDANNFLEMAKILYPSRRMEAFQKLIDQLSHQQIASRDR